MANKSLTDHATIIAAGLYANANLAKAVDLSDPSALAAQAVLIARAVREASEVKPKREKSKREKSKRGKSKRDATPPGSNE